jgi:hypothetical protein
MPLLRSWENQSRPGATRISLLAELLAVGRSVNPVGDLCNRYSVGALPRKFRPKVSGFRPQAGRYSFAKDVLQRSPLDDVNGAI